jgi:hypothetical protein
MLARARRKSAVRLRNQLRDDRPIPRLLVVGLRKKPSWKDQPDGSRIHIDSPHGVVILSERSESKDLRFQ